MENPTPPAPQPHQVPEELIRKFHDANGRFHELRERLDETTNGSEYRHTERVNAVQDELRQAEREIEQVEAEIRQNFDQPA